MIVLDSFKQVHCGRPMFCKKDLLFQVKGLGKVASYKQSSVSARTWLLTLEIAVNIKREFDIIA